MSRHQAAVMHKAYVEYVLQDYNKPMDRDGITIL